MKKRMLQAILGMTAAAVVTGGAITYAQEGDISVDRGVEGETYGDTYLGEVPDVVPDTDPYVEEPQVQEPETQAPAPTQVQPQTDAPLVPETEKSDFVEGSALLSDYGYMAGIIDSREWKSDFLDMKYEPEKSILMAPEDNTKLREYHERNGLDKQISANEMVAKDANAGYVQLMVEVNPNRESAEDILKRFTEVEKLELVSKTKKMEIAGKEFLTCTGIKDKERYMVGVSTDKDNIVIALKIKYKTADDRDAMLKGFTTISVPETEDMEETESEEENSLIKLPKNFEDAAVIDETETETESVLW